MKIPTWVYYAGAGLIVLVYFAGGATGLLVLVMFIILPLERWVISNIFDPNK